MTALIAILTIVVLVAVVVAINGAMRRQVTARHDSLDDAMSDESEPLPSSHLIPDSETAAGDTPEAHDEINPHDLPTDHPGRQAAEAQAEEEPRDDGARTTRGDEELAQAPPEREEHLEPSGEQRGG
jgi:cytoskeletal protein RodZ